jgi:hypothetical protein
VRFEHQKSSFNKSGLTTQVILFCLLFYLYHPALAHVSTYLDLTDDTYTLLAWLEVEGEIQSGLLTTKPISRTERR